MSFSILKKVIFSSPKKYAELKGIRPKCFSQSTLAYTQKPLPEYSGSSLKSPPRELWVRPKTPSQNTLAEAQNPLPEYSG